MKYVSFSGSADSTALAIYLHEKGEQFELVFADTGAELPETYWIVPRVARALGVKLHVVISIGPTPHGGDCTVVWSQGSSYTGTTEQCQSNLRLVKQSGKEI